MARRSLLCVSFGTQGLYFSWFRNREALVTFLALQEFLGTTKTLSQIGKSETEEGKTFKKDESVDPAVAFL